MMTGGRMTKIMERIVLCRLVFTGLGVAHVCGRCDGCNPFLRMKAEEGILKKLPGLRWLAAGPSFANNYLCIQNEKMICLALSVRDRLLGINSCQTDPREHE